MYIVHYTTHFCESFYINDNDNNDNNNNDNNNNDNNKRGVKFPPSAWIC
jgi:hypothetical protein